MITDDRIDTARAAWGHQFGGGMIPFDNAYWEARERGCTIAIAQRIGANALLDAFVVYLKETEVEEDAAC